MANTTKINVLQLITGLGKGGAEKVIFDLCENFDDKLFDVSVLSFGRRDDLLSVFRNGGIETDFYYFTDIWSTIKFTRYIWKKVRDNNIDIIHAHLFHAMVFGVATKLRYPKVKIIFTVHSTNLGSRIRDFVTFLLKPFRIDIIFSLNQKKYYNTSDYFIIENGIDSQRYILDVPKNNTFTFITIGRLEPVKNHSGLIKMVKKVSEQSHIPFQVQIVGEGHLEETLKKEAVAEQVADKIAFLGWRTDVAELCNRAHAFVLPSHWEGLPIALLEAGACGLPVIVTPVGSIPSVIHEENGFLATESEFADLMLYVMNHYEQAVPKGQRLQHDIQTIYDVKVMVAKHEALYHQVTQNHV